MYLFSFIIHFYHLINCPMSWLLLSFHGGYFNNFTVRNFILFVIFVLLSKGTCECQGARYISFSENFAYVLNE